MGADCHLCARGSPCQRSRRTIAANAHHMRPSVTPTHHLQYVPQQRRWHDQGIDANYAGPSEGAVGGNLTLFDVADSHTGELMARSADGGLEIPLEVLWDLVYGDEDDNKD